MEQKKAFESIKALFTDKSNLQSHNPEKRLMIEILKEENILQRHNFDKKQIIETNVL